MASRVSNYNDLNTTSIFVFRDVTFHENTFPMSLSQSSLSNDSVVLPISSSSDIDSFISLTQFVPRTTLMETWRTLDVGVGQLQFMAT
jgi:hypothetical protein